MSTDWEELLNPKAKKSSKDYFDSLLVKVLLPLVSILIAALGLAARELPQWAIVLLTFVLCILFGVLVWPLGRTAYARLNIRVTRNGAAKTFYPDLEQTLRRISQYVNDRYADNLAYELRDFASVLEKKGNPVFQGLSDFTRISEWLSLFEAKAANRRPNDFVDIVKAINLGIVQYSQLCLVTQYRMQSIVANRLLDEPELKKLRVAWNSGRESSNRLFLDWADLEERINNAFGNGMCSTYFPPLKAVE